MKYSAIVTAAGQGVRAGLGYNKVLYELRDGRTVLYHAVSVFLRDEDCAQVIVVTGEEEGRRLPEDPRITVVEGGETRKDSVKNGLDLVSEDYVLVHDGARPFLSEEALEDVKKAVFDKEAVILVHGVKETVKIVEDGVIRETIDRNTVFLAETPQAFKTELLKKAYALAGDKEYTDEASLVEETGHLIYTVVNKTGNPKLTSREDFEGL